MDCGRAGHHDPQGIFDRLGSLRDLQNRSRRAVWTAAGQGAESHIERVAHASADAEIDARELRSGEGAAEHMWRPGRGAQSNLRTVFQMAYDFRHFAVCGRRRRSNH